MDEKTPEEITAEQEKVFEDSFDEFTEAKAVTELAERPASAEAGKLDDEPKPADAAVVSADATASPTGDQTKDEDNAFLSGLSEDARKAWQDREAELEKARNELKTAEHRYNSDVGRVSAYQRQVNQLQADLEEARKQPAKRDKPEPSAEDVAAALATDESWKAMQEDYPEIAERIAKYVDKRLEPLAKIDTIDERLKETEQRIEPAIEEAEKAVINERIQDVRKVHEDFDQIVNHQMFGEWLEKQPAAIQALQYSPEVVDAISLVGYFKDYATANLPAETIAGKPNTKTPSAGEHTQADDADELRRKRAERLRAAESPSPSTDGTSETVPSDDFDSAFDVFATRKARQARTGQY